MEFSFFLKNRRKKKTKQKKKSSLGVLIAKKLFPHRIHLGRYLVEKSMKKHSLPFFTEKLDKIVTGKYLASQDLTTWPCCFSLWQFLLPALFKTWSVLGDAFCTKPSEQGMILSRTLVYY